VLGDAYIPICDHLWHLGWAHHDDPGYRWNLVMLADAALTVVKDFRDKVAEAGQLGAEELGEGINVAEGTLAPIRPTPGETMETYTTTGSVGPLVAGNDRWYVPTALALRRQMAPDSPPVRTARLVQEEARTTGSAVWPAWSIRARRSCCRPG
jgi:hypothetical protein